MRRILLAAAALTVLAACGGNGEKTGDAGDRDPATLEQRAERGQAIFRDRSFGEVEIACVDCHADFDETLVKDDRIRAGHSVLGAHQRVETWNGEFSGDALQRTGAGAAKCAYLYQERGSSIETALTEEEASALMAYYEYISPGNEPPKLAFDAVSWPGNPDYSAEAVEKELEGIAALRGDAAKGSALFDRACAPCHDTGLGPATRIIKRKADRLPKTVRTGDGSMPFFARDKLTDQDVADLQAFIAR